MLKQVMNATFALIVMAVVSTSTFAIAQSTTSVIAQSSLNHAPAVPTPIGTNSKGITECDAGDSKCMEDKAKLEVKPTDGAIRPIQKTKPKVQEK